MVSPSTAHCLLSGVFLSLFSCSANGLWASLSMGTRNLKLGNFGCRVVILDDFCNRTIIAGTELNYLGLNSASRRDIEWTLTKNASLVHIN